VIFTVRQVYIKIIHTLGAKIFVLISARFKLPYFPLPVYVVRIPSPA